MNTDTTQLRNEHLELAGKKLKKHPATKKEVKNIMGGRILELPSDKLMKKGIKKGEGRLAQLMSILLKNGKTEEAVAASESEQLREELYKKYGIA